MIPKDGISDAEIRTVYNFCETFAKNQSVVKEARFTNLFIVHVGEGDHLECVKRYSFRAFFMRVVSWFKGDKAFSIDANLEIANKLFNKIVSQLPLDDKDALTRRLHSAGIEQTGEEFIYNYNSLAIYLKQLQERVERSRHISFAFTGDGATIGAPEERKIERFPLFTAPIKGVFDAFKPQEKTLHQDVYQAIEKQYGKKFSETEKDVVVQRIVASGKKRAVVDAIMAGDSGPLLLVLRSSLVLVLPKEHLTACRSVLKTIAPLEAIVGQKTPFGLAEFSSMLGTGFSRGNDKATIRQVRDTLALFLKNTSAASLIREGIDSTTISSGASLQNAVQKQLAANGRCIMYGGYQGHPMVYCFEKAGADSYRLKIYHEASAHSLPQQLQPSEEQTKGYLELAIKEPAAALFGALAALPKIAPQDAKDFFIDNILQPYGYTTSSDKPFINKLLSPNLPGTSSSRALIALVADTMPVEEARKMVVDLDLSLLQAFEGELIARVNQEIHTEDAFRCAQSLVCECKETLAECELRFAAVEAAHAKLALYTDIIDRIEQKIFAYQSSHFVGEIAQTAARYTVNVPKGKIPPEEQLRSKGEKIAPVGMLESEKYALQAVQSAGVEEALHALGGVDATKPIYWYIADLFFKRFHSLESIRAIAVNDREQARNQFKELIVTLSAEIDGKNSARSASERYGMLLLATFAFEELSRKVAVESIVVPNDFPSLLWSSKVLQEVRALRTTDPYWAERFAEIVAFPTQEMRLEADNYFQLSVDKKTVALGGALAASIVAWVDKQPKIAASIARDRQDQAKQIQQDVKAEIAKIRQYEAEIKKSRIEISRLEKERALKVKEQERLIDSKTLLEQEKASLLAQEQAIMASKGGYGLRSKDKDLKKVEGELAAKRAQIAAQDATLNMRLEEIRKIQEQIYAVDRQAEAQQEKIVSFEKKIDQSLLGINGGTRKELAADGTVANLEQPQDWAYGGIARNVRTDPKYWPWGISDQDQSPPPPWGPDRWGEVHTSFPLPPQPNPWMTDQRARFFFGAQKEFFLQKLQVEDPLPKDFRTFVDMQVLAKNIFYKVGSQPFASVPVFVDRNTLALKVGESSAQFQEENRRPDMYVEGFAKNPSYKSLYVHLYSKPYTDTSSPVDELAVPKVVSEGLETLSNMAPAKKRGAIARLFLGEEKVELQDVMRDLCQLHSAKDVQITSTISFFRENPKRLFSDDGRLLLHALLFESNLLKQEFQNPETQTVVAKQLRNLVTDVLQSAQSLKVSEPALAAQAYANIIWLASIAQEQLNSCPPENKGVAILEPADVFRLASEFGALEYKKEWPIIFESVVAAASRLLSGRLDAEAQKKLCIYGLLARVIRDKEPLDEKKVNLVRARDAAFYENRLKTALEQISPQEMQGMLNRYAKDFLGRIYKPLENVQFQLDPLSRFHVYATPDGMIELSLTDAVLSSLDPKTFRQYANAIPPEVKAILSAQGLYENEQAQAHLRSYKEKGIYCIFDATHNLYIKVQGNDVFVQAEGMPWCYLMPKKAGFEGHSLLNSYLQWHDPVGKKTYFCDPQTLKVKYETDANNSITKRQDDGTHLTLVKPADISMCCSFEDSGSTLYWADGQNTIQEIEFVRLGFSLKRDQGVLCVSGAKEWQVASVQVLPGILQKGGYLVLQNSSTHEKKVFLPRCDCILDGAHNVRYDFKTAEPTSRFVECELVLDKVLPRTLEALYQLASLYLVHANIDAAEKLLYAQEAVVSSRKLASQGEVELLKGIAFKDFEPVCPRITRLQMRALYLLKKNQEQFPKEPLKEDPLKNQEPVSKDEIEAALKLVKRYYADVKDAHPLDDADELLVLESTLRGYLDERFVEAKDPLREKAKQFFGVELFATYLALREKLSDDTAQNSQVILDEKTTYVASSGSKAKDSDRARYALYRAENKLPFNPNNVAAEEFAKYYPFFIEEVSCITTYEAAEKSGLLKAFACMKSNPQAQQLYHELMNRANMSPVERVQSLYPLQAMQPLLEDRGIMRALRDDYFTKHTKAIANQVAKDLFSTKAAEIEMGDTVAQKKFADTAEDINAARSSNEQFAVKDGKSIEDLREKLQEEEQKELRLLGWQEAHILTSVAEALSQDPKTAQEFALKKRHYPTIQEIGFMVARKNYDEYAATYYPGLNAEGRKALQEAVRAYFIQKENVQQLGRSIKAATSLIDAKSQDEQTRQGLQNALATELGKVRAYPADHPYALTFLFLETALNIKLRPDQVMNILTFDAGIQGNKNYVLQMIMGAGKTAVIQPFLAILLANPKALSTVMVPEALFQSVREQLTASLGLAADQMLISFPYDIELSQNVEYLQTVLNRLKEAKAKGATLFISPRQMHSLDTSLKEAYNALTDTSTRDAKVAELERALAALDKKQKENDVRFEKIQDAYRANFGYLERLVGTIGQSDEQKIRRHELDTAFQAKKAKYEQIVAARAAKRQKLKAEIAALKSEQYLPSLAERRDLIAAIMSFMQEHAAVQMDEADMVMNPNVIFKRSIGAPEVFDGAPGGDQYLRQKALADIVLMLANDRELNEKVSIDFANQFLAPASGVVKKGVEINEQIYRDIVQPKLVEYAFKVLQHPSTSSLVAGHKETIQKLLLQQELTQQEKVWLKSVNQTAKDLLGALSHAITKVLASSLLKECKANYGKDPLLDHIDPARRKYIARPYEAPDAPKPTMYADPHEKVIYSVQYYLYNGIPIQDAKEILLDWQKQAKAEMVDFGRKKEETIWFQRFTELGTGLDFFTDPKSAAFKDVVEAFQAKISKNPKVMQEFLEKRVYEQNTIYNKNVTSTPQTLAGSSARIFGYTGTMHAAIMAPFMQALPEKGTDGKTITAMENAFVASTAAIKCVENGARLADTVIERFQKEPDYNVFIDSGNWLKEEKIDEFALKLYEKCKETDAQGVVYRSDIKGVVYHDANNNLVSVEADENHQMRAVPLSLSKLKPHERLTIIRRKYETGTNIPQKPNAKAFMSVRKDMTMRDVLQSAFRMRGILLGQTVDLMFSFEAKSHLAQQLLKGLLSHLPEGTVQEGQKIDAEQVCAALKELSVHDALKGQLRQAIGKYNEGGIYTRLALQDAFATSFIPDSRSCWRYFAANLAKIERQKNWTSARHKMRDVLERPLRKILINSSVASKERDVLFKAVTFFVQHESRSLFDALVEGQKTISALDAVKKEKEQYTKLYDQLKKDPAISPKVKALLDQLLKEYVPASASAREALDTALDACVNVHEIPAEVQVGSSQGEDEVEAEKETEMEQEEELELELELEEEAEAEEEKEQQAAQIAHPDVRTYVPLGEPVPGTKAGYDIDRFFGASFAFPNIQAVLPPGLKLPTNKQIFYTKNFIDGARLDTDDHARNHLSARFLLVLRENDTNKYLLVSHEDAERIKAGLLKKKPSSSQNLAVLCDLKAGVVCQSTPFADDKVLGSASADLLQIKFLMAKGGFTSLEISALDAMIQAQKEAKPLRNACREYYETRLFGTNANYENRLYYLETAAKEYRDSYFHQMLNK